MKDCHKHFCDGWEILHDYAKRGKDNLVEKKQTNMMLFFSNYYNKQVVEITTDCMQENAVIILYFKNELLKVGIQLKKSIQIFERKKI